MGKDDIYDWLEFEDQPLSTRKRAMKTVDRILGSATFAILCMLVAVWVGVSFLWWALVADGWLLRLFPGCYECGPKGT